MYATPDVRVLFTASVVSTPVELTIQSRNGACLNGKKFANLSPVTKPEAATSPANASKQALIGFASLIGSCPDDIALSDAPHRRPRKANACIAIQGD